MALSQPNFIALHPQATGDEFLNRGGLSNIWRRDTAKVEHPSVGLRRASNQLFWDEFKLDHLSSHGSLRAAGDESATSKLLNNSLSMNLWKAEELAASKYGGIVVEDEEEIEMKLFAFVGHLDLVSIFGVGSDRAHSVAEE